MQYLLLIYTDDTLLQALPEGEADSMMRHCFAGADEMKAQGQLLQSQQLESPEQARSVRIRDGRLSVSDGPFAETRELIAGFSIWEVKDMDEALAWARRSPHPLSGRGELEIRPFFEVEDLAGFLTPEELAA
ncbi:hypothetical protein CWM66_28650, partial [Kosakonia sp. H7A]|uniref:YciI family protein n=1 Tax=Kosakonia sp. H7A TaxID=2054598 RepID=UPI000D17D537